MRFLAASRLLCKWQSAEKSILRNIKDGAHMDIKVGNIVRLKKKHPCGSAEWEVLRSGADFRLKCCGCGHQIMIARPVLEKNVRDIQSKS